MPNGPLAEISRLFSGYEVMYFIDRDRVNDSPSIQIAVITPEKEVVDAYWFDLRPGDTFYRSVELALQILGIQGKELLEMAKTQPINVVLLTPNWLTDKELCQNIIQAWPGFLEGLISNGVTFEKRETF